MALCDVCWGSGVVDEGTPEERECPFCCGTDRICGRRR